MIRICLILPQLLIIHLSYAEFIYDNLFDYSRNLTCVYKNPNHVYSEDLMRTAVFYLDELMELEEALEDEDEKVKALNVLTELYSGGGPKHTMTVPYDRFIDTYNWTSKEVDDYARYIEMTTESWGRLLKVINKYIKSGKITIDV